MLHQSMMYSLYTLNSVYPFV